jgi:outer membrane protein TolC
LSASGGFEATNIAKWFSLPSRFWSLGAGMSEVVFEGGKRRAQVHMTEAQYDSTVAAYRQTVLTAFQQVEDNLAALRILAQEAAAADQAAKAAQRLAGHRYLSIQSGHCELSDGHHRAGHRLGQ